MYLNGTAVPRSRPSVEPTQLASTRMTMSSGTPEARNGMWPSTSRPTGNIRAAATRPLITPMTVFWSATAHVGRGASSRSSISMVTLNSICKGRMVVCKAVSTVVRPTVPGKSTAAYVPLAYPSSVKTLPKMKSMKIGCTTTMARKTQSSRPVTRRSRASMARKARSAPGRALGAQTAASAVVIADACR